MQTTYPTKALYLEYIKKPHNSKKKKKKVQSENSQDMDRYFTKKDTDGKEALENTFDIVRY